MKNGIMEKKMGKTYEVGERANGGREGVQILHYHPTHLALSSRPCFESEYTFRTGVKGYTHLVSAEVSFGSPE